jgi:glycine dehydrogenase
VCIHAEAAKVESGEWGETDNPLHNAPHTLDDICDANWDRSYDRQTAAYPVASVAKNKFWPSVNRIDDVYGDRHLICSCPSIESYIEE